MYEKLLTIVYCKQNIICISNIDFLLKKTSAKVFSKTGKKLELHDRFPSINIKKMVLRL